MTASYATYGILDSNRDLLEEIAGLQAAAVCHLPYGEIGVAVSPLTGPIQDVVAGAVEHEAVVERLMRTHTVLPMRFPTVFSSREAVLTMVSQHYGAFRENLHRLHHQVEFGIRVIQPGAQSPSTEEEAPRRAGGPHESSGTQYLCERYRQYRCTEALRQQRAQVERKLDTALSRVATAKRLRSPASVAFVFDGIYLVPRDREADFRRAFADGKGPEPGFRYLFSGPWPPYNFVTI